MNNYNEEWSLNKESFEIRLRDVCKKYNIINPNEIKYYSQQDEDKYIIQYFLNEKINDGTFLEVGACDGVLFSNTKTLEDNFGFSGILIEPQYKFYRKLLKNRPQCECYNAAISSEENEYVKFYGNGAEGGIWMFLNKKPQKNKIKSYLNPSNWLSFFFRKNFYNVPNKKISDILRNSRFKYIDFMFIDVEGSELELLKTIDFSFPIFCLIIEAHSDQQAKNKLVREFLLTKGFVFKIRQRGNEVWINHNYFRKHLFYT